MRVIVGAGNTQQPGWLPLQQSEWSAAHGAITRCANSSQSNFLSAVVNAPYTSLIVDAVKR
jgi:hypothetical protein